MSASAQLREEEPCEFVQHVCTFPLQEVTALGYLQRPDPVGEGELAALHEVVADELVVGAIENECGHLRAREEQGTSVIGRP